MHISILYTFLASGTLQYVSAQSATITPLIDKQFSYPSGIPYQADPDATGRGPQSGYNLCNSTTEGPDSMCQTAFVNHADDFCLWAPPTADSTIADTEAAEVAWCSKSGYGTRLFPAGALTGVQFMRTADYLQVVGFIDQTQINLQAGDPGGELDPHGADGRGNPLGALMYSNGFSSNNGNNNSYQQVIEWNNFMGDNMFCIKVCDPVGQNAAEFCNHSYDRLGCAYNAPNNAQDGVFEACDGDDQDFVGIYTTNGEVMTYSQPPASVGAITTAPYQPRIPASSNCVQYQSTDLYPSLPGATNTPLARSPLTMTSSSMSVSRTAVNFGPPSQTANKYMSSATCLSTGCSSKGSRILYGVVLIGILGGSLTVLLLA